MHDPDLPKSFWKSKTFIVLATFCATILLLSAYVFLLRTPPLIISEATTRITGPLTADGQIDFFKALEERIYPPELATDDNGFRDFVRLFGDVGEMTTNPNREFYRLQKYEKLGLDPNVPPTLTHPLPPHEVFSNFYKAKGEDVPAKRPAMEDMWTLEQYPMLADWINEIDVPMDAVAETIQKPVFFSPLLQSPAAVQSGTPINLMVILLPDIQFFRNIARIFQARATYRIGNGDIDGAIDDKLTIHRLSRLTRNGGSLVQHLVGIAIEGVAVSIPVGANPEHPLTEAQLRRLLDGLDALPPRAPVHDAYEWERYVGLSCIQDIARNGSTFSEIGDMIPGVAPLLFAMSAYSCNWNVVYRRMNEAYDAMQEPPPRTKFHSFIGWLPDTKEMSFRVLTPGGRGMNVADVLIALLLPATVAFEEAINRSQCAENMQRLALAILLYRCEKGEFPDENWAVQIEKYLGENPQRYFSCPTSPSPDGETTYALVQYDDTVASFPDLLLVELTASVPLDKAVISADDVLSRKDTGSLHPGGMNVAHRSAAVRFLSSNTDVKELQQLLGRVSEPQP